MEYEVIDLCARIAERNTVRKATKAKAKKVVVTAEAEEPKPFARRVVGNTSRLELGGMDKAFLAEVEELLK